MPPEVKNGPRLPVTVCIVSGAEAQRIGPALESVAEWAAEIVVVFNEEVKDGTEEIAVRYGAKVFREPWKGFVGQKNSVVAKASRSWLFNLDADERVSPALAAEIRAVVSTGAQTHAAYEFPRCSFYCGRWIRHGDWYPDHVRRLWRRGLAVWRGVEPHSDLEVQGTIGRLRSDLLHYSNESIAQQISKIAPYQSGAVERWLDNGDAVGPFELGVRPFWRFLRAYIFRLGLLDGWQGFYIAAL